MFDKELVKDILLQVYEATQKILKRFEPIRSANDFTNSESGMEKDQGHARHNQSSLL